MNPNNEFHLRILDKLDELHQSNAQLKASVDRFVEKTEDTEKKVASIDTTVKHHSVLFKAGLWVGGAITSMFIAAKVHF